MAGNKKQGKPYRPKWNAGGTLLRHEMWKIAAVFAPIEAILAELEHDGTVTTDQNGKPLFFDKTEGHCYEMGPSIRGLTDAFDLHSRRNNRPITTNGLAVLCLKLEMRREVEAADIAAAKRSVAAMRAESAHMTSAYASRLVSDTQLKFELEDVMRRTPQRAEPQRMAA
jgi:hypothetical protein